MEVHFIQALFSAFYFSEYTSSHSRNVLTHVLILSTCINNIYACINFYAHFLQLF